MAYALIEEGPVNQSLPLVSSDDRPSNQSSLLDKKADFNILEKLKFLRDNKKFCDVILEVRGVKFVAHKNVLASWSPTFAAKLFADDPKVFKDYIMVYYDNSEVFSDLLDFMYNGYVAPRETNFLQLLHLAVSFQIETLKNYCEEFLRCNLHLGNFVSTYFLSRKFKLETLEEFIVGFLQLNLSDAVKQGEFLSLRAEKFNTFLSEGWMKKIKPEIKLFLIISWVGYDVQEREKYLVLLLGHINWSTVANDFLLEINRTENFFTSHESSLYLLLQTLYSAGIPLGPYKDAFPRLRETHSAILTEVVHTSLLKIDTEEFRPVTISIHARPGYRDSAENTILSILPCNMTDTAMNTDVNSLHFEESEKDMRTIENTEPVLTEQTETSENKYEQFETLGEFIEAEIHEIKQRENQERLQKEQDRAVDDMDNVMNFGMTGLNFEENTSTEKETKPARKSPNSGKKKSRADKNKSETVTKVTPARQSPRKARLKKKVSYEEEFEEDADDEVADKDYKPKEKEIAEKEEDSESDYNEHTAEQNKAIVSQIKTGGKKKVKGRNKKSESTEQESTKALMCEVDDCAYITKFPQRMDKHIKMAHQASFELRCNLCVFETKEVRKYNTHMKQHFPGPPYKCDYPRCTVSSEKIQSMLIHRSTHTDERPFTCECGMRFRTNNTLIAHKKVHLGKKEYTCPDCGVSFATRNTLSQHSVTHSDVRPYLCDLCGFSTKFQSHLITHKRLHTGEVFSCQFPNCSYFSPKRSQLKAHMRAHLGIRAHVCEVCSKSFVERSHLVRHQRIHTNSRIACEQCDYTTTRKDKLKEHVKKHHSDEAGAKPKKLKLLTVSKSKSVRKSKVVEKETEESLTDIAAPMIVKWDHGGYSLSQEQGESTSQGSGEGLLNGEGEYCVLRDPLNSGEPIQQMLTIDQISGQISVAKSLDSGVIVSQDANMLHETGTVDASLCQNSAVTGLNSAVPVINLLNSPLGSVDQVASTSKLDSGNSGPTYTIIQTTSADGNQQQEYGGLSAFMAFI